MESSAIRLEHRSCRRRPGDTLRGLRAAAVPPVPAIRPAPLETRRAPAVALAMAAAMLLALVAARLAAVESKLPDVEHDVLRALLAREVEHLRRELEPALHCEEGAH